MSQSLGVFALFHEAKEMRAFRRLASVLSSGKNQNRPNRLNFVKRIEVAKGRICLGV